MTRLARWPALVAATLVAGLASADDRTQACTASYVKAQTLRSARKLIDARRELRVCAAATCTAFIARDCAAWLSETEGRIPTVVFEAKDAAGAPARVTSVSLDGVVVGRALDGRSIDVDPGEHTVTFVGPSGATTQTVTILEGQKAQLVSTTFDAPSTAPPVVTASARAAFWTTRRGVAVAAAGVGVVGIVVGGTLGAAATSAAERQTADCSSATLCPNHAAAVSAHGSAATDATVSTVGFLAAGAFLVGGAVLWLTDPRDSRPAPTAALVPWAGEHQGGLALQGAF